MQPSPPFTLPGTNVLLMGPAGTGKTHSIGTLVDTGVEVFYLALESGMESLLGYWTDRGKPIPSNLHWHKLAGPKAGFKEMIENATKINTLNLDAYLPGLAAKKDTSAPASAVISVRAGRTCCSVTQSPRA